MFRSALWMVAGETNAPWIYLFRSNDVDFLRSDTLFAASPAPGRQLSVTNAAPDTFGTECRAAKKKKKKAVLWIDLSGPGSQSELIPLDRVIKHSRLTPVASSGKDSFMGVWKEAQLTGDNNNKKKKQPVR